MTKTTKNDSANLRNENTLRGEAQDMFYSDENMAHLNRITHEIDSGEAILTEHDLIDE